MIEIRINGELLELEDNAHTKLQHISPFFDTNQISGEYSLPVNLVCSERNLRLLGYLNELPAKRDKVKINTVNWSENDVLLYRGTLITESVSSGMVNPSGKISAYFVTGVSNFWQKIKNKRMQDLELGGKVDMPKGLNPFSAWVNDSLSENSDSWNFVFAPIHNDGWSAAESNNTQWMNQPKIIQDDSNHFHVEIKGNDIARPGEEGFIEWRDSYVAMPYLIYVFKKIFTEHGYTVNGEILNDADFKKIIIPNFNGISTYIYVSGYDGSGNRIWSGGMKDLYLADCMPDMSIGDFIIAIRNKFALGFQFTQKQNKCLLISLNDVKEKSRRTDFSMKVNPQFKINFPDKKIFSFTQEFDSADASINAPDFNKLNYLGPISDWNIVIAPKDAKDEDYFLWTQTNQFYRRSYDEETDTYAWVVFADNIYDYTPSGATDSINSKATTMRMKDSIAGQINDNDIYLFFPFCQQQGNWINPLRGSSKEKTPWGLRLLFYHGIREINIPTTSLYIQSPYVSNSNYQGNEKVGEWSLSYKQDGDGLFDLFWKRWIEILQSNEEVDFTLYPALHELLGLEWSDIIMIRNTPYLLKQKSVESPYDGRITAKAVRIPL